MLNRRFMSFAFFIVALAVLLPAPARAWQQGALPGSHVMAQTMHYGGDRSPLETVAGHLLVAKVDAGGATVWSSSDAGAHWSASPLQGPAEQARMLAAGMVLTWSRYAEPVVHRMVSGNWVAQSSSAWPLARSWLFDAAEDAGNVMILASDASTGKLVEGPLYIVRHAGGSWQQPALLASGMVGDARLIRHASGMWTAVWSERLGDSGGVADWHVMISNSPDAGMTWSAPVEVVAGLLAPASQESAILLAAAALPADSFVLAFTGWSSRPHSQIWVKRIDALSGSGSSLTLLPDAGDMVYSPAVTVQPDGRWEVAWQQKVGIDMEIYLAERSAGGLWGQAMNVSLDPFHLNYDVHIGRGLSHAVHLAWTRVNAPGNDEVYQYSFGDAADPSPDSDGDGIPDRDEAGFDMDGDGIDDAYSAKVATWSQNEGRYGLVLETAGTLSTVQSLDVASAQVSDPVRQRKLSGMLSFRVTGLQPGGQAQVRLLTPHALPQDARWMKWNAAGYWQDAGLPVRVDGHGLHIVLTDGGAGDEDRVINGEIVDPGMLTAPLSASSPPEAVPEAAPAAGGGGGCLISMSAEGFPALLVPLLLMAMLGLSRR